MAFEKEIVQILNQQQKALTLLQDEVSELSISTGFVTKLTALKKRFLNHELLAAQLISQLENTVNSSIPPVTIVDAGRPIRTSMRVVATQYPLRSIIVVLALVAVILHREIPEWLKLLW